MAKAHRAPISPVDQILVSHLQRCLNKSPIVYVGCSLAMALIRPNLKPRFCALIFEGVRSECCLCLGCICLEAYLYGETEVFRNA